MNLRNFWPDYFGLTQDLSFLEVRRRHYPLEDPRTLSKMSGALSTKTRGTWLGFPLRLLIPFIAFEASAFVDPLTFKTEQRLKDWVLKLREDTSWDQCVLSRLNSEQAELL